MIRVPFFLIFTAATLAAHWIVVRWSLEAFPWLRARRRWVYGAALALVAVGPIARGIARALRTDLGAGFLGFGTTEAMLVILGAIPLALVRLAIIAAAGERAPSADATTGAGPLPLTRRQAVERISGAVVLGSTASMLGWGMVRGRHAFTLEEVVVKIPGLPRALDGYTIAQVSDIHVGTFVGARELAEGLDLVRRVRPDLLVATGDLVDFDGKDASLMARALADVPARDGVVGILGNHDYYAGAGAVVGALRSLGVDVLINAGRTIRAQDGGGFALLGVDDRWGRRAGGPGPDLRRALAMVNPEAPRILLAHQPQYFPDAAGKVALQLSGHMHGGQINPGFCAAEWFSEYVAGRYERAGSTLWVNRGFGVAGPPTRVGAPPEVTKIVLVAA